MPVALDLRRHRGLPVRALAASFAVDPQQVRVFELNQQAGALAEVAPDRVPYHLHVVAAWSLQRWRLRLELEDETILPVDRLLAGTL